MIDRDKEEFLSKCSDQKFVRDIIDNFHKLYYYSSLIGGTWKNTTWFGVKIQKNPMDLIIYQEIINFTRPDYIIETGTKKGGSALFFADMCDIIKQGQVITIDINKDIQPVHRRISYLTGNSIDPNIVDFVKQRIKDKKTMVILDSDHSKQHVLEELKIYSEIVSVGSYLIVEDTNCSGFPIPSLVGEGPMEAVKEFLEMNDNYKVDISCEKFYFTFNPCGYLVRVK